jgi:hypothetical protein
MNTLEQLSRLMDGDLDAAQTGLWRKRIEEDPEVAAAWAELVALRHALDHLPEEAPPPHLVRAVVNASRGVPSRPAHVTPAAPAWRVVPWLVAAAALLVAGLQRGAPDPATISLVEGVVRVEGEGRLALDGMVVDFDGRARITRDLPVAGHEAPADGEPAHRVVRASPASEDLMDRTHALSAAAGAALTIAVQAGTVTLRAPGAEPVVVQAGETRTVGGQGPEAIMVARPHAQAPIPASEPPSATIARLEGRVAELEQQLALAAATSAVARGQLEVEQGHPSLWPDDVPEAFRESAVTAAFRASIATHPGTELVSVDCAEYPCIAVLKPADATEGWQNRMRPIIDAISATAGPADLSVSASAMEDGDKHVAFMGVALAPENALRDEAGLDTRTRWRTDTLLQDLGRSELEAGK